jgi:hypothetical protein
MATGDHNMAFPHPPRRVSAFVVAMRRNPISSEADAFRLTVTTAGLVIVAGLVGWLTTLAVGVVVFAALACVGLAFYMSLPEHDRHLSLRHAAHEAHPHGALPGKQHVIIVANEVLAGDELSTHIRSLDSSRVEIAVLAPVLTSRTHLAYTDIDKELRQARERLARSLAWARTQGFVVRGEIGDASPAIALEDKLRDFGADEVIVTMSRLQPSRWQERVALERLRDELDVPVVEVAVD